MSILQEKGQLFVDTLLTRCKEKGNATINAYFTFRNELHLEITIDGKLDTYDLFEDNLGAYFIRTFNGTY